MYKSKQTHRTFAGFEMKKHAMDDFFLKAPRSL